MNKETMEKISQIAKLACELTNDDLIESNIPVAMVRLFGHCALFEIYIFENGWQMGVKPTYKVSYYVDIEPMLDSKLDEIIAEMNRLCEIKAKMLNKEEF